MTLISSIQQGAATLLLSTLQVLGVESGFLSKALVVWITTLCGTLVAFLPTICSPRILKIFYKFSVAIIFGLAFVYWLWFPAKASGHFQSSADVFSYFHNGNNRSTAYTWIVATLYSARIFRAYDAPALLAEETLNASPVAAKGIFTGALSLWLLSTPTLLIILMCNKNMVALMQNKSAYYDVWAQYLLNLMNVRLTVLILLVLWFSAICSASASMIAAQRLTHAMARDGMLPLSQCWRLMSGKGKETETCVPRNAAFLVLVVTTTLSSLGVLFGSTILPGLVEAQNSSYSGPSSVSALATPLATTSTIALNLSYLFPIVTYRTLGRNRYMPGKWHLGRIGIPLAMIAVTYIFFENGVLLLPEDWPVKAVSLALRLLGCIQLMTARQNTCNYAPVLIGISALSITIGWWFPRWGARHWFRGSRITLDTDDMIDLRLMRAGALCSCQGQNQFDVSGATDNVERQSERGVRMGDRWEVEGEDISMVRLQFAGAGM